MQIKTDYLVTSPSRWEALAPYTMTPTEITFHNTYNDASALNEVKNVFNNSTGTSFHTAVDDKEVQQVIPFNRNAWHSGDGGSGAGNRKSIGVEICYSMSGGDRYRKSELNAIDHISDLMVRFGIPISKVKTHQERNGKYCPHRMLDEGRVQWFKNQCEAMANSKRNGGGYQPPVEPTAPSQPQGNGYDSKWFTNEDGYFKANTRVNMRADSPSGNVIRTLSPGEEVRYNGYGIEGQGHVWLRIYLGNGAYAYVASGESSNGKRTSYWGSFR